MSERIDIQLVRGPVRLQTWGDFPQPAGAECIFLGRTRREEHARHGALMRLSYDAYEPMAEGVLRRLAEEAIQRFGCRFIRIHHALGEVPLGEASVLVQVVAGHRAEAFDACRHLMDALKREAPIWKREEWEDGTTWSQGAAVQQPDDTAGAEVTT